METIKELLNERDITDSTKNLYIKKLEMLHKGLGVEGDDNFRFLRDTERTLDWINQFKSSKKRTLLNACMAGLSPASKTSIPEDVATAYKFYSEETRAENKIITNTKSEQKMTEREGENWATTKDLKKVLKTYYNALVVKGVSTIGNPPTKRNDIETLQKYLVGSLYIKHPPRRLEYGNMIRISHDDYSALDDEIRNSTNFIVTKSKFKWYFSFGNTKIKTEKAQIVPLHKDLVKLVKMWYATTPDATSFLLTRNGDPQTSNGLSHFMINRVFEPTGKLIGATMIRKIYLSEKYAGDTPLLEKMNTASLMNHSPSTADLHYVKKE